jgi:hypothetical protein
MASSVHCPNCGATNDPIHANCVFCKSPLPRADADQLDNEELIMRAAEWTARASERSITVHEDDPRTGGKRAVRMVKAEIVGNAKKYLALLSIRAASTPALKPVLVDLEDKLAANERRNPIASTAKKILIGIGAGFAALMVLGAIVSHYEDEAAAEEIARLRALENQIQAAIDSGKYDRATTMTEGLYWSVDHKDTFHIRVYDEHQRRLRERIAELRTDSAEAP